jgi:hypothetical protein
VRAWRFVVDSMRRDDLDQALGRVARAVLEEELREEVARLPAARKVPT